MSGSMSCDADPVVEAPSRLAGLLRWLGTAAVALSGIVFLVQGLEQVDVLFRTYAYLLLMGLLTVCGLGTRTLLDDARSARLLLGLAVALVPIQFAQLGGMLHSLTALGSAPGSTVAELFGLHALSAGAVAVVAAATLLLTPLAAFAGFAVLVRPAARLLTLLFLVQNALLLLPWRDSLAGFAVLVVLALCTPAFDRLLIGVKSRFATPEGRAVRGILLIPFAIAGVRLAFHVESDTGLCALLAAWGAALVYAGRSYVDNGAGRELLYLPGTLLVQVGWVVWTMSHLQPAAYPGAVALIPAGAVFLLVARLSSFGSVYQLFATACLAAAAVTLLHHDGLTGDLLGLSLGLVTAAYGYWRRDRCMVLAGPVIIIAATAALAVDAWQYMAVNSWVALAAAGVLLVVCSSVVERFGRSLVGQARDGWQEVRQWQ